MSKAVKSSSKETHPISEEAALADILTWSQSRPGWQRDALRRLIVSGEGLTEQDLNELFTICIGSTSSFLPLLAEHVSPESSLEKPVSLIKIENPTGVNALANDQVLNFAVSGLTVVYGDNGSGKSGYVRVLKNACRSRDSKLKILPDINAPHNTPQAADIHYATGTNFSHLNWSPTSPSHPNLSSVSIFDSRSANTHLGSQHHVAYTPFPMMVLQELSQACDILKTKIESQIKGLQLQTPEAIKNPSLDTETAAGAFLRKISPKTKLVELEQLTNITDEEKNRVASLQADLAGDPKKVVASLVGLKNRLVTHAREVSNLIDATSESEFQKLSAKRKSVMDKSEVARLAAEKLFEAATLPEIGGEHWKALWEAARSYSNTEVNKDKAFPSLEPTDACVLCLQPLNNVSLKRWATFEEFIKGTTKSDELHARTELSDYLTNLEAKVFKA